MQDNTKKIVGDKGEEKAVKYLKSKKYKIVARNFSSHYGEVDIIAEDKEYLVFIEVKTRSGRSFGNGYEAVGNTKIKKIVKTAEFYIMKNNCENKAVRFDVVSIDDDEINHIENAFTLE